MLPEIFSMLRMVFALWVEIMRIIPVPMRSTHGRVIDVPYSGEGIATTIERYVSRGDCIKDWFILLEPMRMDPFYRC